MKVSELRENNTIFLMHLVADAYVRKHRLTWRQFQARDRRYRIVRLVSRCPDIFDNMSESEMVKEIDDYIAASV